MKEEVIHVIKIGGNVLDTPQSLKAFVASLATTEGKKILVHGGGVIASEIGKKLGITPHMAGGRRITDAATLDLVCMVYAGLLNKKLVAQLQASGMNALGMSGTDGNLIRADRRPAGTIDYGFVGDLTAENIQTDLLLLLLNAGVMPVIAPVTHDGNGQLLNTNADTIASTVAIALARHARVTLNFCFEKKGVLEDINNEHSVIPLIDKALYAAMKQSGKVSEGMLPKLDNAFHAIDNGVLKVTIGNAGFIYETINNLTNGGSTLVP